MAVTTSFLTYATFYVHLPIYKSLVFKKTKDYFRKPSFGLFRHKMKNES